ncbi:lipopolysaccharide biosynthesis protein [Streptomyces pyxinae]|uniref:lipopolysaccharide biosynthesis protein n=1 Tax=Streptomyces pyxinae TaxID=2970734 RepID=UPI002867FEFE|nr:lipopolysaccharide biosynthesis protein [Streptomyces sp. LP05-1]
MSTTSRPLRSRLLRPFRPLRRLARLPRRIAAGAGWLSRVPRRLLGGPRFRRWLVPVAVLAGALAGGAYGVLRPPEYAATSYVVVVPQEGTDPAAAMGLAQAYGRVATDVAVAGDAPKAAGVSPAALRAGVRAATSPDAPMVALTARARRPAAAVRLADSVARSLVEKGGHTETATGVKVVHFARAARPTGPVSPSAPLAALVGGCGAGLLGGLALLVRPRRPANGPVPAGRVPDGRASDGPAPGGPAPGGPAPGGRAPGDPAAEGPYGSVPGPASAAAQPRETAAQPQKPAARPQQTAARPQGAA